MPKPSRLRAINPTPAHAAQGVAPRVSGVSAEAEPPPPGSVDPAPATAAPAPLPSGVSIETVPKRGRRRSFSAAEKLRIVRAAAACTEHGEIEALLRRERIYSSHLTAWRKLLALHGNESLAGRKPGRKPTFDAKDRRIAELEKRAARLEAKLSLAEKLIDLQKNHPGLRPTCRREARCATLSTGSEGAAGNFLATSIP